MTSLVAASLIALLASSPATTAAVAAGRWNGTVNCAGQPPLRLQVVVANRSGGLFGLINSPDQNFASDLKSILVDGHRLHVEADVPGNFVAVLDGNITGTKWEPVLSQGPLRCPTSFTRDGDVAMGELAIPPSYQSEPMWCWLTVGEMAFRHYGVLSQTDPPGHASQCRILRAIMLGSPNFQCSVNCDICASLGGGSSREVAGMLSDFPRRLTVSGAHVPRLFSAVAPVLTASEVASEIDAGNPVIIGISPGPAFAIQRSMSPFLPPMHVALIVGYIRTASGDRYLVNDPYPFPFGLQNPYLTSGAIPLLASHNGVPVSAAYWVTPEVLKTKMNWSESILIRAER